ncbi:hypothetical protein BCR43DRAFT_561678, partial [Syncephalastrum racemosum]
MKEKDEQDRPSSTNEAFRVFYPFPFSASQSLRTIDERLPASRSVTARGIYYTFVFCNTQYAFYRTPTPHHSAPSRLTTPHPLPLSPSAPTAPTAPSVPLPPRSLLLEDSPGSVIPGPVVTVAVPALATVTPAPTPATTIPRPIRSTSSQIPRPSHSHTQRQAGQGPRPNASRSTTVTQHNNNKLLHPAAARANADAVAVVGAASRPPAAGPDDPPPNASLTSSLPAVATPSKPDTHPKKRAHKQDDKKRTKPTPRPAGEADVPMPATPTVARKPSPDAEEDVPPVRLSKKDRYQREQKR